MWLITDIQGHKNYRHINLIDLKHLKKIQGLPNLKRGEKKKLRLECEQE